MALVAAARECVRRMLSESPGMKCLVVDKWTLPCTTAAYTQSEILAQEVFLVETLGDASDEEMRHLKVRAGRRGSRTQQQPLFPPALPSRERTLAWDVGRPSRAARAPQQVCICVGVAPACVCVQRRAGHTAARVCEGHQKAATLLRRSVQLRPAALWRSGLSCRGRAGQWHAWTLARCRLLEEEVAVGNVLPY